MVADHLCPVCKQPHEPSTCGADLPDWSGYCAHPCYSQPVEVHYSDGVVIHTTSDAPCPPVLHVARPYTP